MSHAVKTFLLCLLFLSGPPPYTLITICCFLPPPGLFSCICPFFLPCTIPIYPSMLKLFPYLSDLTLHYDTNALHSYALLSCINQLGVFLFTYSATPHFFFTPAFSAFPNSSVQSFLLRQLILTVLIFMLFHSPSKLNFCVSMLAKLKYFSNLFFNSTITFILLATPLHSSQ